MTRQRKIESSGPRSLAEMNGVPGAVALVPIGRDGQVIEGEGAIPLDGDPRDDDYIEDDAPPSTPVDRVREMLGGVAGDERAIVKISRLLPNQKESWCEDVAPHDFEHGGLQLLRDKWGPGTYRIRLYGMHPNGSGFKILKSADLSVEASRLPAPAPGGAPSDAMAQALQQLADNQKAMVEALTNRPQADPLAEMSKMLALMGAMRGAMGLDRPAEKKSSIGELADAMRELKGMSDLMGNKEPEDESLTGMVKGLLPNIVGMIGQQRQPQPQPQSVPALAAPASIMAATPPSAIDAVAPAMAQPVQGDDMGIKEDIAALVLRGYLASLILLAEKGAPVEEGAALVYDKLPDEAIELLDLPTWFDLLQKIAPEVAPHHAWFTLVRDRVVAMLDEDAAEDTAAGDSAPPEPPAVVVPVKRAAKAKKEP